MKRLLLFLVFAGSGFAVLTMLAGGFGSGTMPQKSRPLVEARKGELRPENVIKPGPGLPNIENIEGITQLAPPRAIVWKDRLSDESIAIPDFIPWRFLAADATPMKQRDEGKQAVRCNNVVFLTYREPASRAEAMALLRSEPEAYTPLLHQRFSSDEARVFGRLADRMQRKSSNARDEGDTHIQLDGNVRIVDEVQGTTIKGDSVTVWPDQERADGRSRFTVEHEAFVLAGRRLLMERVKEKGWSRLSIMNDPVLDIVSDVRNRDGKPIFDFGPGDFRPAHISSEGRAILVREDRRRESVITVTFTNNVTAEQVGGRKLTAERVRLIADRSTTPVRAASGRGPGWKLRNFEAEGKVHVDYKDETARGKTYIASFTADRMTHDVPRTGMPLTTLDGDPVILMRGQLPLLGPGGRMRASCRDRAWIGPVPAGLPTSGLPVEDLQHIALRGQARVERTGLSRARSEDVLEGDEIDLLVFQRQTAPAAEGAPKDGASDKMVATYFAALGNVRLDGTRIRGTAHRLVGEELHTEHPHVAAEGRGKRFVFPDIGGEQRLLGPENDATPATQPSAPSAAPGANAAPTPDHSPERREKGNWVLNSLRAVGAVDIDTSMGGPALGIPANVAGHEVNYDRVSRRAQVVGPDGGLARIAWGADGGTMNVIETPILTLDRAQGVVTAQGGVHGEIYMARQGGGNAASTFSMSGRRSVGGDQAGASLTVRTDARIDIDLTSMGTSLKPRPGAEQHIRIDGPVTTELRSAAMTMDRMQSDSLEVGLVYEVESEDERRDDAKTAPAASAGASSPAPTREAEPKPKVAAQKPERFEVEAGEMRAHLAGGEISSLEATGNVDMRGENSHVSGKRLTYDAVRRHARVYASKPDWETRPAVAILGDSDQRTEVRGAILAVSWTDGEATSVDAQAPSGEHADIRMYSRAANKPGRLESYALLYWGRVNMTPGLLRAGRVRLVRKIREAPGAPWGPPTALWAPTLRVIGSNMLSADEQKRDMRRILAEGPKTTFQSGGGVDLIKVWGDQFDFDMHTQQATLRGKNGSDVTIRKGAANKKSATVHVDQTAITIDMKTNMPTYMRGGRIIWDPPKRK